MTLFSKLYKRICFQIGYTFISMKTKKINLLGISIVANCHQYIALQYFILSRNSISELLKDCEMVRISGTGVLLIFFHDKVIKLPLGLNAEEALSLEHENYLMITNSSLHKLTSYTLEKMDNYYVMDRLFPVNKPYRSFKNILAVLSSTEYKEDDKTNFMVNQEFKQALNVIKTKCDSNNVEELLQRLENIQLKKGVAMHGDLTPQNIMQTATGKIVVIDIDRFKMNGLVDIDRLHYIIEHYVHKKQQNYFDILQYILSKENLSLASFSRLLTYFLYRINVENSREIELTDFYYDNLCKITKSFLKWRIN